jgi:membrane-associated phospholipid phosphatase
MTRARYLRLIRQVRDLTSHLPGGELWLSVPTGICAVIYIAVLFRLLLMRDARLLPAMVVPFFCFVTCTLLRALINRPRPYDQLHFIPVGRYRPNKGKSLPSRHTACAVAISCAVVYIHPFPAVVCLMTLLTLVIGILRVVTGKHYPSDVLCGILLSMLLSILLYALWPAGLRIPL